MCDSTDRGGSIAVCTVGSVDLVRSGDVGSGRPPLGAIAATLRSSRGRRVAEDGVVLTNGSALWRLPAAAALTALAAAVVLVWKIGPVVLVLTATHGVHSGDLFAAFPAAG